MPNDASRYVSPYERPEKCIENSDAWHKLKRALKLGLEQEKSEAIDDRQVSEFVPTIKLMEAYAARSGALDREKTCLDLSKRLWAYWESHHSDLALAVCIEAQSEVLDLCASRHPRRANACADLALSLTTQYDQTGEMSMLTKAITLGREALALRPSGHPYRALSCTNLATSLESLFYQTGDSALLDEAIMLERQALALRPVGHPARSDSCTNLAASYLSRYEQRGDDRLLDIAIILQQEALDLCLPDHPGRVLACGNLAISLWMRYRQNGDVALFDRSIALDQEALDLRPAGHPDRARVCTNLAVSLITRYQQSGDDVLLDRAIQMQQEVLALLAANHPYRSRACCNLGFSLITRYSRTKDGAVIEKVIELEKEALNLRPVGHPDRAESCGNLALSLMMRYELTGDQAHLHEALLLQEEALDLNPAGHPDRFESCTNLALSLKAGYLQSGDAEMLDRAIELNEEALSLTVTHAPKCWRSRVQLAELTQLLPQPDWDVIMDHLHHAFNAASYDDTNDVLEHGLETLCRIDASAISRRNQQALLALYASAIDLVALAAGLALDTSTQLRHILRGSTLGPAAFSLAARLDELPTGLELLERARGVIWARVLRMRDPQLDRVPEKLATKLRGLLRSASNPGYTDDDTAPPGHSEEYRQRSQLQDVVRQIRSLPGLSDFMRGPDNRTLLNIAARNRIVVLIADQGYCHALLITSGESPLVHLPFSGVTGQMVKDFTFEGLASQQRGGVGSIGRGMVIARGSSPPYARLAKLWRMIVKPVLEQLSLSKAEGRARPRIHWCPTGPFAFVPVHAAGIYQGANRECCSDYVVSSYTPTLTALIEARKGLSTFAPQQIRVMTAAAEHTKHDMPPLHYAVPETRGVTDIVSAARVLSSCSADTATKPEVLSMLRSSHVVHLACHGIQHKHEPHKSRFCLSTCDLAISELMALDLQDAFLAFLSACETARGDEKHADETVHLAASLLFAGFKSVVATMWAMNDADGPLVAREFYERLFQGSVIDVDAVPYALDEAVASLRRKGVPPGQWATFIHMGA